MRLGGGPPAPPTARLSAVNRRPDSGYGRPLSAPSLPLEHHLHPIQIHSLAPLILTYPIQLSISIKPTTSNPLLSHFVAHHVWTYSFSQRPDDNIITIPLKTNPKTSHPPTSPNSLSHTPILQTNTVVKKKVITRMHGSVLLEKLQCLGWGR